MKKVFLFSLLAFCFFSCKEKKCCYTIDETRSGGMFPLEVIINNAAKIDYDHAASFGGIGCPFENNGRGYFLLNIDDRVFFENPQNGKGTYIICKEENASRKYYKGEYEVINFDELAN